MGIYQIIYKSLSGEKFKIIADSTFVSKKQEGDRLIWSLSFQIRPQNSNLKNFSFEFGIDETLFPNLINFVKMKDMEKDSFEEKRRRILLVRMGFDKVMEALDENVLENKKFILDVHNYPSTDIKDLWKRCEYLHQDKDIILCKAPFISGAPTNFEECEMCLMPEYFARCKHLIIRKGKSIEYIGGSKKLFLFECERNFPLGNPQDCINPPKSCFEPRETESPKLCELKKMLQENNFLRILTQRIDRINTLTKRNLGKELFKIHAHTIWLNFHDVCLNTKDFILQINALSNLMDWMNIKQFPISNPPEEGTLNFLEQFLKEKYPEHNNSLIKRFRKIKRIRQRIHTEKETPEIMKIMKEYNVKDLQQLLEEVKIDFLLSLKQLEEIFLK